MTTYELIKSMPDAERERMVRADIISDKWKRYIQIYEYWLECIRQGEGKMDAYLLAGDKYFMNEDNVRKVVAMMRRQA